MRRHDRPPGAGDGGRARIGGIYFGDGEYLLKQARWYERLEGVDRPPGRRASGRIIERRRSGIFERLDGVFDRAECYDEPHDQRILSLRCGPLRDRRATRRAAIAVVEDGEITFARGFGSKHPTMMDPVRATTLFRIGSVTKVLTAAVLLQQVAEGRVSLDDPITTPLPTFAFDDDPSWAPSILIRHLLTHASGVVDYGTAEVPPDQQADGALETFLLGEFGRIAYLMAPSGRMWNYSNPNFCLAGLVAQQVSGTSYRA